MRTSAFLPVLIAATCIGAAHARADIYTWTDSKGRVHMTDDKSRIPPEHRASAHRPDLSEAATTERSDTWNSVPAAHNTVWKNSKTPAADVEHEAGRKHVLYVDKAGREMSLSATLDGSPGIPFIVDTGAMLNTIPLWAVRDMGIELTDDTPTTSVSGIGGRAMQVPVITIGRVELGTAVVENVEMAVLSTMNKGLLGMPFFNNFKVQTDPTTGRLTLEEIDLNAIDGIYAGLDESAWRSKFAQINGRLEHIAKLKDNIPSYFQTASGPFVEKLEKQEEHWQRQLDDLEAEATRAAVPPAWRHE